MIRTRATFSYCLLVVVVVLLRTFSALPQAAAVVLAAFATTGSCSSFSFSSSCRTTSWAKKSMKTSAAAAVSSTSSSKVLPSSKQQHDRRERKSDPVVVGDENKTTTTTTNVHLLSLQWTDNEPVDDGRGFSSTVRAVWRWKDAVLGDGRDFFVPKPKTVAALQSYLLAAALDDGDNNDNYWKECVVLSNCARFEILVVTASNTGDDDDDDEAPSCRRAVEVDAVARRISSRLLCQVASHHHHQQQQSWRRRLFQLQLPLDWPGMIDPHAHDNHQHGLLMEDNSSSSSSSSSQQQHPASSSSSLLSVPELSRHWTVRTGPRAVATHLALVAAGLAPRPRRPDRPVVFRPFSSRDAHILLQLKRTLEVAGATAASSRTTPDSSSTSSPGNPNSTTTTTTTNGSWSSTLLRGALQAGKAARNPTLVPELLELRRNYGTGNNPKFDRTPPMEVSKRVAAAARRRAIAPAVRDCAAQWTAREQADRIQSFRTRAFQLLSAVPPTDNDNEAKQRLFLQKQLHEPTLQLRGGLPVDETTFLENLAGQLAARRTEPVRRKVAELEEAS